MTIIYCNYCHEKIRDTPEWECKSTWMLRGKERWVLHFCRASCAAEWFNENCSQAALMDSLSNAVKERSE